MTEEQKNQALEASSTDNTSASDSASVPAEPIENPYRRRCLWMLVLSCIPVVNCILVFPILAIIYGVKGKKWAKAQVLAHPEMTLKEVGFKFSDVTMVIGIVSLVVGIAELVFIAFFVFITTLAKAISQGLAASCSGQSGSGNSMRIIGRLIRS